MRRVHRILIATAMLALTARPALADTPPKALVEMKAEAGFEGRAKAGHWVPVTLTLTNTGADFEGIIRFEATSTAMGPMQPQATIYRTPVIIPAGATKRVQIYLPESSGTPTIELVSGDTAVASVQPQLDRTFEVLLGVLGVEPADLKGLGGMKVGDRPVRMVMLDAATMPGDPMVLENLDAILMDRFTFAELPEPQRQALQSWVEHGGTLIAAGGPEAKRLEGMAPWAPLSVQGIETVMVDKVGEAHLAALAPNSPFQVTWRSGNVPLVATLAKGAGEVHFLAFDPALEPFASWSGLQGVFQGLLPTATGLPQGFGPNKFDSMMQLQGVLSQFPMQQPPSTKGLLYVLGGYALLIGPVHFLFLRGFRRTAWAIISLPILTVAGAGSAYAYAQKAKASDVSINAVAVIEGQPGATSIRVREMAGFYMPPGSKHTVAFGDALLTPVPPMQYGPMPVQTADQKVTMDGAHTMLLDPREEWGMRVVSAEQILPTAGTVAGTIEVRNARAEGQLTNQLGFPLEQAVVVSGGNFQMIGDMEPGKTYDVSLMLPAFNQQFGGANNLMEALGRAFQFNGWGPGGPTPEQMEQMRRQQMSWAGANSISWAMSPDRPPIVLAGFAETEALPAFVDGKKVSTKALALYVQPVTVAFTKDDFSLPAGYLQPKVLEAGGPNMNPMLWPGWSLPKDNSALVEFTIPVQIRNRVEELELSVPLLDKGNPMGGTVKYPMTFAVYRWSDGTWQSVTEENERATLTNPAAFIGPDGGVRFRLTQTEEFQRPMGTPGLAVRGGKEAR